MIKIIAFDLVGVLVTEKNIELITEEDKLERMYGSNIDDSTYLEEGKKLIGFNIDDTTTNIINKLYLVKDKTLFEKLKNYNKDLKIIIATNHVSYIRSFIENNFDMNYLDDIVISSEIHKIKPNKDFYEHILNKYNIKANELLFLDDNFNNINGANSLNINTIKVEKDTNLYESIINVIDKKYNKKASGISETSPNRPTGFFMH